MLSWSIRLFRVFGIQLAAHSTFFILVGYVAWEGWSVAVSERLPGLFGAAVGVAYLVVFFGCVVLHELGHALTARRFGVGVPRILLLPIGGMAEFSSIPRKPSSELIIALAGPAVNFAIIAVLLIFVPFPTGEIGQLLASIFLRASGSEIEMSLLQQLMAMNLIMGGFNLVPVFPMDGGRVLRALLATKLSYLNATYYAASVGKALAAIGALTALFYLHNVQMTVLFSFIFIAGQIEYQAVKRREWEDERWRQLLARIGPSPSDLPTLPNQ